MSETAMTEAAMSQAAMSEAPVSEAPVSQAAAGEAGRVIAVAEVPVDRRRGGELRVLLGPKTVGSTSGFMGVATLRPGERIGEHYHPYSEEFLYVTRGEITVDLDDQPISLSPGEGLFIPRHTRHRLRNAGTEPAEAVFHLGPLAPRPELGHVDTESAPVAAAPAETST
ncbi:cupin domain-containing protein [Rugosimonospora acidiphila]|uniref:Cupin domain-containing protein n=1 Tax=Rugosimonospora acidiphila TaxID=556531 RepID=A0ABP9SE14_9ACTN